MKQFFNVALLLLITTAGLNAGSDSQKQTTQTFKEVKKQNYDTYASKIFDAMMEIATKSICSDDWKKLDLKQMLLDFKKHFSSGTFHICENNKKDVISFAYFLPITINKKNAFVMPEFGVNPKYEISHPDIKVKMLAYFAKTLNRNFYGVSHSPEYDEFMVVNGFEKTHYSYENQTLYYFNKTKFDVCQQNRAFQFGLKLLKNRGIEFKKQ